MSKSKKEFSAVEETEILNHADQFGVTETLRKFKLSCSVYYRIKRKYQPEIIKRGNKRKTKSVVKDLTNRSLKDLNSELIVNGVLDIDGLFAVYTDIVESVYNYYKLAFPTIEELIPEVKKIVFEKSKGDLDENDIKKIMLLVTKISEIDKKNMMLLDTAKQVDKLINTYANLSAFENMRKEFEQIIYIIVEEVNKLDNDRYYALLARLGEVKPITLNFFKQS